MKKLSTLIGALLFLPACLLGFIVACARAGYETGTEIATYKE